jgi:hypothetical protein
VGGVYNRDEGDARLAEVPGVGVDERDVGALVGRSLLKLSMNLSIDEQ